MKNWKLNNFLCWYSSFGRNTHQITSLFLHCILFCLLEIFYLYWVYILLASHSIFASIFRHNVVPSHSPTHTHTHTYVHANKCVHTHTYIQYIHIFLPTSLILFLCFLLDFPLCFNYLYFFYSSSTWPATLLFISLLFHSCFYIYCSFVHLHFNSTGNIWNEL